MTRTERLMEELREALETCNEIEEEEAEIAAGLKEKRGELKAARARVEEIQREILTGSSGRPILERIAEKEESADERQRGPTAPASAPPPAKAARPRKRKAAPAWQDVAISEILPDDAGGPAIIDKVANHLELPEDQCPTVGDLALIWFSGREQPHTLEAMATLTPEERETLRRTLREFRESRGWPPRVGLPEGFPAAWLEPEPAAPPPAGTPAAIREPILTGANHADGREPEPAGPVHWTSADLEEELERACKIPLGQSVTEWRTFRELGSITDLQIVEVLRAIWPQSHAHQEGKGLGKKKSPGYTIHGGVHPAFWIGARRPETLHKPTLEGKALIDRVRSILGLPRAPQSVEAEAAAITAESTVDTADRPARKGRGPRKAKALEEVTA